MPKIGVLLSGCGVYDGSEIHEAVLVMLALDRAGAEIFCMAPDVQQQDVVNHVTGKPMDETRNVLIESARIARGKITDIAAVTAADMDGLIIPGGFGAAKNLSDFATQGQAATVHLQVQRLLNELVSAGKPMGAVCIAPATLTCALAEKSPEVTIGNDLGTAQAIEAMGGQHQECSVDMIHVDVKNKVVSTPAYMLGPGIKDVAVGIEKLVNQVLEFC